MNQQYDFNGLKYRIDKLPDSKKVIEQFPDLMARADVFESDVAGLKVDNDKVLRYLIYMYSPGSPLIADISDLSTRKKVALKLINVEHDADGCPPEAYQQMCNLKEKWIVARFVAFCLLQDDGNWLKMHVARQEMEKWSAYLLNSDADAEETKVSDQKLARIELEENSKMYAKSLSLFLQDEASFESRELVRFTIEMGRNGRAPEDYIRTWAETGNLYPTVIP